MPQYEREIVVKQQDDGFDDCFDDSEVDQIINKPKAKQFIAFSDSRQAAAYFSTYFSETYNGILYGKLINEKIKELQGDKKSIPRFVRELATVFRKNEIAPFSEGTPDYEAEAWKAVLKELVDNKARNSLMGLTLRTTWRFLPIISLVLRRLKTLRTYALSTLRECCRT